MLFSQGVFLHFLLTNILSFILFIKTWYAYNYSTFSLWFIRWVHFFTTIFLSLYMVLYNRVYDIVYLSFVVILNILWIVFKNECYLSYVEKKFIDTTYVLGSQPYEHPFISSVCGPDYLATFKTFLVVSTYSNLIVVMNRTFFSKSLVLQGCFSLYGLYLIQRRLQIKE
jgi:hypothetical protein